MLIQSMDDRHLLNSIRMLIRNRKYSMLRNSILITEASRRGLATDAERMLWALLGLPNDLNQTS